MDQGEPKNYRPITYGLVVAILGLQVLSWVALVILLPTWSDRADFGAMFGAIGSTFSGLALAGVVYAILLQRQELALQRQELELTRAELARAANAHERSAVLLTEELQLNKNLRLEQEAFRRAAAMPQFDTPGAEFPNDGRMSLSLRNLGPLIRNVEIVSAARGEPEGVFNGNVVPTGAALSVEFKCPAMPEPVDFMMAYIDNGGATRTMRITYDTDLNLLQIQDATPFEFKFVRQQ